MTEEDNNAKSPKSTKNHDMQIRLIIYGTTVLVTLFMLFHSKIENHFAISSAEGCFNRGNYVCAFKSYKKAFNTGLDNKKYIGHYFETLKKMKKVALVQGEMYKLLVDYPDNNYTADIEAEFAQIRETITQQYPDTYINDVVQGSNVVHWNNKDNSNISVFIDTTAGAKFPGYYVDEVKKAFADYSEMMGGALKFEYINDSSKAKIRIVFMDKISGGQCQNEENCSSVMGLTENSVSGSLLTHSTISLRFKDTDNTDFTKNQIYNIAKHEIGHALGVSGHSYNPNDIMYPVSNDASWSSYSQTLKISRIEFSPRDIATFRLLYDIVPDITDKRYNLNNYPYMNFPIAVIGTKKEIALKNLEESRLYMDTVSNGYIAEINLAEGYFASGDIESADGAFQRALLLAASDDEKFTVYNNLAVIYYDKEDFSKALEYADMANSYSEKKLANEIKAYCYIEMKNYKQAQQLLENLVRENPENPTYSAALTGVYFKQYNTLKGLGELKRIKKINPAIVDDPIFKPYKTFLKFV